MAVVVTVIVVALLSEVISDVVVMINIAIVVMVVIVIMEDGCRSFMIHMAMHAFHRRPGELERNDQHEEDGKQSTHRLIVPKSDYRLSIRFCAIPAPSFADQPTKTGFIQLGGGFPSSLPDGYPVPGEIEFNAPHLTRVVYCPQKPDCLARFLFISRSVHHHFLTVFVGKSWIQFAHPEVPDRN